MVRAKRRTGGRAVALFLVGAASALATLALLVTLPHDRFILWQSLRTEAYARLGWSYERIHFDPTPIDIAFIGTSHTMNGVDGSAFEARLAADGVRGEDGRCLTATNFAIPAYGRNLHWELAKELLENRRVRILVLEVFENETRKAHPAFVHVADVHDVMTAPLLINLNYFNDIVRLPFRQLSLWAESARPKEFGLKTGWDPTDYDGSTVDNTRVVNAAGVALTPPRYSTVALPKLQHVAKWRSRHKNLHLLGSGLAGLEYRYPLHYLDGIRDEARRHGTQVVFLYLPGYGWPDRPYDTSPYAGGGRWLFANDILRQPGVWYDDDHLNAQGAAQLTTRIADAMASGLPHASPNGPCQFGYRPRATLNPFKKQGS